MPAIAYKKTETDDGAWDAGANEKKLANSASDLRAAFAWVDSSEDPDLKSAYKFIHHFVNEDGSAGAASTVACSSGIGVLNGGRGGTTIPDADKSGVHAHLAHHLEDSGKDAPELKSAHHPYASRPIRNGASMTERVERRIQGSVEVRATSTGATLISGYAAVFNSMTTIDDWFGSYGEKCAAGCFTKTLADGADVRALYNHDPNFVLGRTKSGTLRLSEDAHGLAYEVEPPDTAWARDLCATMRRGDVDGSSFGFRVIREKWTTIIDPNNPDPDNDGDIDPMDCRTLLEVQLYDVSPVTFPAYPETDSMVRAALQGAGFDLDQLARVVVRGHRGLTLASRDRAVIRAAVNYLSRYVPADSKASPGAPAFSGHPPTDPRPTEPTRSGHSTRLLLERFARLNDAIDRDRRAAEM